MDFLRKLAEQRQSQAHANPPDDRARAAWPLLWELLTLTLYADGSERLGATLKVAKGIGCWQVTLCCDQEDVQFRCESFTLEEVFKCLEQTLSNPDLRPLPYKSYRAKPKPRKKNGGGA